MYYALKNARTRPLNHQPAQASGFGNRLRERPGAAQALAFAA
jgi:hypothetical protein